MGKDWAIIITSSEDGEGIDVKTKNLTAAETIKMLRNAEKAVTLNELAIPTNGGTNDTAGPEWEQGWAGRQRRNAGWQ